MLAREDFLEAPDCILDLHIAPGCAGELLGDEQTGQIHEIGFTLYTDLLERAVDEDVVLDQVVARAVEVDQAAQRPGDPRLARLVGRGRRPLAVQSMDRAAAETGVISR